MNTLQLVMVPDGESSRQGDIRDSNCSTTFGVPGSKGHGNVRREKGSGNGCEVVKGSGGRTRREAYVIDQIPNLLANDT